VHVHVLDGMIVVQNQDERPFDLVELVDQAAGQDVRRGQAGHAQLGQRFLNSVGKHGLAGLIDEDKGVLQSLSQARFARAGPGSAGPLLRRLDH
jgi:hypothetical protein